MIYGVNVHHLKSDLEREALKELGIRHVRMDITPDNDWRDGAEWCFDNGLSVHGTISYSNNYYYTYPEYLFYSISFINVGNLHNHYPFTMNEFMYDWMEFFTNMVNDYNCPYIVHGEFSHTKDLQRWLSIQSFQNGVLAHHVYGGNAASVRRKIKSNLPCVHDLFGDFKKLKKYPKHLWITETGLDSAAYGSEAQADFVRDLCNNPPYSVSRIYFYELIDDPRSPKKYGLVTSSGERKPAFFSLQWVLKEARVL